MDDELISLRARFAPGWVESVACGPGWTGLLSELDSELAVLDPDYRVFQVKEKFGGLRFYAQASTDNPEFVALIRDAEDKSFRTCEECGGVGAPGKAGDMGWVRTLCADCAPEGWEMFGED